MKSGPLASASQVALIREIQVALNNRDDTKLSDLANHPHFWDVLEIAIQEDDLDVDSTVATIAALKSQNAKSIPENRVAHIWDDLYAKTIGNPLPKQDFTDTHKFLLLNCSKLQRNRLVNYLVKRIAQFKEFDGARYYQALSDLYKFMQEKALKIDMLSTVTDIEKHPSVFVDYLHAAKGDYEKFRLKCSESELQNYIVKKIPDNLAGLSVLSLVSEDYDFTSVIQRIEEEISSDNLTAKNIGPFYDLYKALSIEKPIEMIDAARVANLLLEVKDGSETQLDLLAMRLAIGPDFPRYEEIHPAILTNTDEDMVRHIAERIECYETFGELLLRHLAWPQPILKAVLVYLTLNSNDSARLNITEVLTHYGDLRLALEIEPQDFIRCLDDWGEWAEKEITVENIFEYVTDYELLEHALQVDCDLSRHLLETATRNLSSLSSTEWQDILRYEASFAYKVAYLLLDVGKLRRIPANAAKSYQKLLIQMVRGELQISKSTRDLFDKRMDKRRKKSIAISIRDLFIDEVQITSDDFLLFSNMLLLHGGLTQRSGETVKRIMEPVAGNDECLLYIIDNKSQFFPILEIAGSDAMDFKSMMRKRSLPQRQDDKKLGTFAKEIGARRRRT